MSVFHDYTDLVEPLSLDEAYLDVTTNKKSIVYASAVAKEIRRRIYDETKLTASAGVAPNKFLAKIASDMNKPNGLTVITPNDVTRVLKDLPVRAVPGVGRVTEEEMQHHGIFTTGDLLEHSETGLVQLFGKSGHWFYRIARGEDDRPVEPDSERKSVGAEDTFAYDVIEFEELETRLEEVAERVWRRLHDLRGRTVTLKVTYADFEKITRSKTFDRPVGSRDELYSKGIDMLKLTEAGVRPIRLLGLSLHNLVDADTPIVLPPRQLAFPFLEELLRRAPMKRRDGIF